MRLGVEGRCSVIYKLWDNTGGVENMFPWATVKCIMIHRVYGFIPDRETMSLGAPMICTMVYRL